MWPFTEILLRLLGGTCKWIYPTFWPQKHCSGHTNMPTLPLPNHTHTRTPQSHCICKPRRKHTSCGPPVCHWAVLWEGTIPITQWSLPAHGHFNRHRRRRRRVQLTHQAGCGCLPLRQHNDNGGFRGTLAHTVRVVSVQIYIAVWHKSINEKGHMKSFGKQRPLQIKKKKIDKDFA